MRRILGACAYKLNDQYVLAYTAFRPIIFTKFLLVCLAPMQTSDLDVIISRIQDQDAGIQRSALKALHREVASAQGSVDFRQQELLDRLNVLSTMTESIEGDNKKYLYDLLSVMSLTHSAQNVLRYRLRGCFTCIEEWGIQYVRKLVHCILDVIYQKLEVEDYTPIIVPIVKFLFKHNSEIEAIDLILEVSFTKLRNESREERNRTYEQDYTDIILDCIDSENKDRVILYLEEMDKFYDIKDLMLKVYLPDPTKYLVYLIKLNEKAQAIEFVRSTSGLIRKQCLYILARNDIYYETDSFEEQHILSNSFLSDNFFHVATLLELLPPQKLDYIFKGLDKEKTEAAAIANALVHFAYGRDPVFFPNEGDHRIKDEFSQHLKTAKSISTIASVGLIHSYSHEKIFECYSGMIYEKPDVGALLALAIAAQRHHDLDSSILGQLSSFLSSENRKDVLAAMLGISLVYSCSGSSKAYEMAFPLISSPDVEVGLFAIYVLGSIYAGSGDEGILSSCIEMYNELKKDSPFSNLATLGIALIFMKKPELVHSQQFSHLDNYTRILSLGLMNIGTGDAAVVDEILTDSFTGDTDALLESIGLISSCLVGIGDGISTQLLERIVGSSLLLDSQHLRTSFPLCLALLYSSNPKTEVIDALEKSINSGDADVNSLISLGIIGAGTRSSRILRVLDSNYNNVYKDSRAVSALIISQGLVNLGKGLFTLSPLYCEKNVIADRPMIGLLSTIFLFVDQSMFADHSYLCYLLSSSISPKYVVGYEGSCRVGRPVDVVGMAGKPNNLSATVIHTLPVILNANEKVQVDDDVCTAYIEDVLIKSNK